jgi:hypothetical protein
MRRPDVTGWKPVTRGTAILAVMRMPKLQDRELARCHTLTVAREGYCSGGL